MNPFLIGVIVLVGLVAFLAAIWWAVAAADEFDCGIIVRFAPLAILVIVGVALLVQASRDEEAKGPCLREETGYTMVGKVMTPYTYCVERGTWVDQ
ncbi:hypothetical protein [Cellulomonas rhizosphaerae]|uniref:Transmembrane protein n=1 Tax=Cellulomonas rhizosphaerae TaxID=2293719 RepID=A0A413RJJ5_9CELL|nr:hypothetical protein [Cellulomonas rhizosphaerae]RHA38722.1 hypothetical protein D1825_13390 [Cellulomonas rhizosphaerae]